jgi:hypothetical protein
MDGLIANLANLQVDNVFSTLLYMFVPRGMNVPLFCPYHLHTGAETVNFGEKRTILPSPGKLSAILNTNEKRTN